LLDMADKQEKQAPPRQAEGDIDPPISLVGSRTLLHHTLEDERPREKAKRNGFEALTTAELLAILVRVGTVGESVIDLCHRILKDNDGKLYLIARKGINNLKQYRGIGEVKAIEILAALELARRYQQEEFDERYKIIGSMEAYRYLRPRMEHLDHEVLMVVLVNNARQVMDCVQVSSGGVSMTVGDIKMILRPAIERLATGIVLAHNHPSDNPHPSGLDDSLTLRVLQACRTMDIKLLDHIIVCRGNRYFSYLDEGRIIK